jgi:CheY-like chemotaxis protein
MDTFTEISAVRDKAAQRSLAVLLVEDEVLIRMALSDMLEELGHRVVGEAGDIESASAFAMTAEYDLAILDINLQGNYVDPVADLIALRDKPFIFASGYGPEVLPSLLRRRPLLRKPVSLDSLRLAIDRLFEGA